MTDFCLAPDPHPRRPTVPPPPGAVDAHVHLFGPAAGPRLVAERDYTPPEANGAALRRLFDALGIARFVVIQPSVLGSDNRDQLDEAGAVGLPFRAIVVVDPAAPDTELAALHARGARGWRFILAHPGGLDPGLIERAASRAAELGWHLQFLVKPHQLVELAPRLGRLPCPVVIDHLGFVPPSGGVGQEAFVALLRLAADGNGWAKISGAYRASSAAPGYDDLAPFAAALLRAAPERVLWGSDWPHVGLRGGMPATTDLLDTLLRWVPDPADRARILVSNPEALFDF